jgi:hypothetical protein
MSIRSRASTDERRKSGFFAGVPPPLFLRKIFRNIDLGLDLGFETSVSFRATWVSEARVCQVLPPRTHPSFARVGHPGSGHCGEFELFGVVFVDEGVEVCPAAGFVETGGADDHQLLRLAEALGVDGGRAADHADGGELCDFV